jgi:hypothetical protein
MIKKGSFRNIEGCYGSFNTFSIKSFIKSVFLYFLLVNFERTNAPYLTTLWILNSLNFAKIVEYDKFSLLLIYFSDFTSSFLFLLNRSFISATLSIVMVTRVFRLLLWLRWLCSSLLWREILLYMIYFWQCEHFICEFVLPIAEKDERGVYICIKKLPLTKPKLNLTHQTPKRFHKINR